MQARARLEMPRSKIRDLRNGWWRSTTNGSGNYCVGLLLEDSLVGRPLEVDQRDTGHHWHQV